MWWIIYIFFSYGKGFVLNFLKNKKVISLLFLIISAQLFCEEVIVPVFYSTNEIDEAYWSKDSKSFAYKTNNKVYIRNTEDLMLTDIVADFPKSYIINDVVKKGRGGDFPRHLQNVHADSYTMEREQGYLYPHDFPNHWVKQQYLPDELMGKQYYEYGPNKLEQAAKAYWDAIKK